MGNEVQKPVGAFKRIAQRLSIGYKPDGEPLAGAPRTSRYTVGVIGPSPRLDQDIDELRRRIEQLERGVEPQA